VALGNILQKGIAVMHLILTAIRAFGRLERPSINKRYFKQLFPDFTPIMAMRLPV
jgi:hypothetical protein